MCLVKAAKASPHAKFYSLSTDYKYDRFNFDISTLPQIINTNFLNFFILVVIFWK